MKWRDARLRLQVEEALGELGLTPGHGLKVFVHEGALTLVGKLSTVEEFDAVLYAVDAIPGVTAIGFDVEIAEPIVVPSRWRNN